LNTRDEISIPEPVLKRKPPPEFGSGKLGTPLARMHLEYASASASRAACESGPEPDAALPAAALEREVVVLLEREVPSPVVLAALDVELVVVL
jgi:hypothetical protein